MKKNSIKGIVVFTIILEILLLSSVLVILWTSDMGQSIKLMVSVLSAGIALVSLIFYVALSKHVKYTLGALSETIQSMIDDKPKNTFSQLEDTLLSKLQNQIVKLTDILKSHTLRQKKEKETITALISDISHQLKTPLANLNMYNTLLLEDNLPADRQREFIEDMQSQIEKLNWLMESLIKMSRLETGIINLNRERQNIVQTLFQAISMVSMKAEQKGIDITFEGDESLNILYDTKWTGEALFNILDNAVKYSPNDTSISISLKKYELFCRIDISDSGRGIKEFEINKIFSRFYRGENAKDCEGVGIGLFLTRKIIGEQGGYIKVKSISGGGSTFSVFLPLNS